MSYRSKKKEPGLKIIGAAELIEIWLRVIYTTLYFPANAEIRGIASLDTLSDNFYVNS